jgi:hypothetical protein
MDHEVTVISGEKELSIPAGDMVKGGRKSLEAIVDAPIHRMGKRADSSTLTRPEPDRTAIIALIGSDSNKFSRADIPN